MNGVRNGFTLVELAIVLIVIGILTGGGMKLMGVLAKKAKVLETKEKMQTMQETVLGFAMREHRLPTQDEWDKLFLDKDDSWGKKIRYIVDGSLTKAKNLCHQNNSHVRLSLEAQTQENLAFILVSSGPNRNLQTAIENMEVETAFFGEKLDLNDEDFTREESFDDTLVAYSMNQLQFLQQCDDQKLKIINDDLPKAITNRAYETEIFVQGGATFSDSTYRWCMNKKSLKKLSKANIVTFPQLSGCDTAVGGWKQAHSLRLKSFKVSAKSLGTVLIDLGVSDRFDSIKQKKMILNVEQDR
ncbi:MAG: type II secretion system GspH family protein [Thiovulaceae bacterium]|nr:type II secretion system GspH family protein [Sulfurimonadaceae bacterium]